MNTVLLVVTLSFHGLPAAEAPPHLQQHTNLTLTSMEVTGYAECKSRGQRLMATLSTPSFESAEFDCIEVPSHTDY